MTDRYWPGIEGERGFIPLPLPAGMEGQRQAIAVLLFDADGICRGCGCPRTIGKAHTHVAEGPPVKVYCGNHGDDSPVLCLESVKCLGCGSEYLMPNPQLPLDTGLCPGCWNQDRRYDRSEL